MAKGLWTAILLVAALAAINASAQTIPPILEMRAKIDAFVAKSYPNTDIGRVHVEYADINSDGLPEAFVIVPNEKACGADPCALVLDLVDDAATKIDALSGREIRALQTKNGKWRDIMLDGTRLRWHGDGYK